MHRAFKYVYRECRVFLIFYFLVLVACLALRLVYTRNEIFFGVNEWHGLFADRFFRVWTHTGDWLFTLIVILVMLLFSYRKALIIFLSTTGGFLVGQALKFIFGFPRPDVFYRNYVDKNGIAPKIYFVPDVVLATNKSFPSGHTITAFTLAMLFAYFTKKKTLSPFFLALAVLLAFSRMYLKQHFFEDVVAGSAVGVVVTFMMLCLVDARPVLQKEKKVS